MTDRELLELAAKAVGITLDFRIRGDFPPYFVNERGGHSSWRPLDDDGDALRLVVTLRENLGTEVSSFFGLGRFDEYRSDPYAATRRAIVRAAAEIGKAMK